VGRSAPETGGTDGSAGAGEAARRSVTLTAAPGSESSSWHFVTCEYPPRFGGVADFTRTVAHALAGIDAPVHVWTPGPATQGADGVVVHELPGAYHASALAAIGHRMDACPAPRRLFVQWVPHGYGYKSLNVPFCRWIRTRARAGDALDLMVHEPFLPFERGRLRQNVGAVIHRAMLRVLLSHASRVFVSTPAFLEPVKRFGPRRAIRYEWLPVPSPLAEVHAADEVAALRQRLGAPAPIVGYFGTAYALVSDALAGILETIHERRKDVRLVLAGVGTDEFVKQLSRTRPAVAAAVVASGAVDSRELSLLLQSCDVFVQPYPDGVSARRTTLTALLAHGRPVVSNSGPRTEPFWRQADAVTLVDGGASLIADAALRLVGDEPQRGRLSTKARELYREKFDVERSLTVLRGTQG
jgi:glycosyltransferase involved in cell wall biosynthesis